MTGEDWTAARQWREASLKGDRTTSPAEWTATLGWPQADHDQFDRLVLALFDTYNTDCRPDSPSYLSILTDKLVGSFGDEVEGPEAFLHTLGLMDLSRLDHYLGQVDALCDQMLTHLEVWESQQTRYGISETRMTGWELISTVPITPEVREDELYLARELALRSLLADGQLLPLNTAGAPGTWVLRSRGAELARLITNLRQRFPEHLRHTQSPRLVRDVKFEVVPREVPNRSIELEDFLREALTAVEAGGRLSAADRERAQDLLAKVLTADGKTRFAPFQRRAFARIIGHLQGASEGRNPLGTVVAAGTGSGKTLAYFAPALLHIIVERLVREREGTKTLAIYPRRKLAEKQFEEFLRLCYHLNRLSGGPRVTLAIEYGGTPHDLAQLFRGGAQGDGGAKWDPWPAAAPLGLLFPAAVCPACGAHLYLPNEARTAPAQRMLRCTNQDCPADIPFDFVRITKADMGTAPPDVLVAVTESLNDRLMSPGHQSLFGDERFCAPSLVMVDEIHLHTALQGMQVGYLLRRLRARLTAAPDSARGNLHFVGLSATIAEAQDFFHELTGVSRYLIEVQEPNRAVGETRVVGAEYYLFVKPHASGDTAVLSTLIQTAMAVVHNMWQPEDGNYKTFGFVNSLDIAYRWNERMVDAETNNELFALRAPSRIAADPSLQDYFYSAERCNGCQDGPRQECLLFQEGECWWFMEHGRGLNRPVDIDVVTSRGGHPERDLVIATSSLEVGYDDSSVMAVLQYLSPHNPASFVQRKGRGGRVVGTRPLMVTVLSPYRTIDVFNFQNHHRLLDPSFRKLPLNPENRLVRRIHGFYALFDWLSRKAQIEAGRHRLNPTGPYINRDMVTFVKLVTAEEEAIHEFRRYLSGAFSVNDAITRELLADASEGVLATGLRNLVRSAEDFFAQKPPTWTSHIKNFARDYVPQNFFSDINLPEVSVRSTNNQELERNRVALGLSETSLGKVSFRWSEPHWLPLDGGVPRGARTLAIPLDKYWVVAPDGAVPLSRVPRSVAESLQEAGIGQQLQVYRPSEITVAPFRKRGTDQSAWRFHPDTGVVYPYNAAPAGSVDLTDRTTSYPLSFYECQLHRDEYPVHLTSARHLGLFGSGRDKLLTAIIPAAGQPWLRVRKVYAGAEAVLQGAMGREHSWTVTYEAPEREAAALGFQLETEGVAFSLNRDLGHLLRPSPALSVHLRCNRFRHTLFRWAQTMGQNIFAAQRAADVLLTLAGTVGGTPSDTLIHWAGGGMESEAETALKLTYGHLSARNREAVTALLADDQFRDTVAEAAREAFEGGMAQFLRDTFFHSLKHALKKTTQVIAGVDTPDDLSGWVQLSADYPNPTSDILLFELGMYGTGLMKPVHEKLRNQPEEFWREVERLVGECPVASEEELLRQVLSLPETHLQDLANLVRAVEEAPGSQGRAAAMSVLARWFREKAGGYYLTPDAYRSLRKVFIRPFEVGGFELAHPIENWRLYREVERFRTGLTLRFRRPPTDGEVRALLCNALKQGGDYPGLQALFNLYRQHRKDLFTSRVDSFQTNLNTRGFYRTFAAAAPTLDFVREMSRWPDEARREWLSRNCAVSPKWINAVDEALFGVLGSTLTYAEIYWRIVHQQMSLDLQQDIEEALIAETLQDAIGRRILQTCLDGCPDCLESPCDVESPAMARQTLSRQLLTEYLAVQKEACQVRLDTEEPGVAVERLAELLTAGEPRVFLRYMAGDDAQAAGVVTRLKSRGVWLDDDQEYFVEIHGTSLSRLDLAGRCEYEIALQIRGK